MTKTMIIKTTIATATPAPISRYLPTVLKLFSNLAFDSARRSKAVVNAESYLARIFAA